MIYHRGRDGSSELNGTTGYSGDSLVIAMAHFRLSHLLDEKLALQLEALQKGYLYNSLQLSHRQIFSMDQLEKPVELESNERRVAQICLVIRCPATSKQHL